jgi:replication fork clamp-binding protein CrfC
MSMERLSQQVNAYVDWKRELVREITRYRSWLAASRLNSEAVEAKLERALRLLRTDHITLAFIGEFSRGKTELINCLFFSAYGQRMLPSQAGRTTMCPTELFFDPTADQSYIRLLPIETRITDNSVAQLKRVPGQWLTIALNPNDATEMADAFSQVAKTKAVPLEHAMQLGFDPDMLEAAGEPDQVLVPAWRHALVNFDHPLLRKGLRILDTPGLNALGSEPELTLSMLPAAQAIIFLLAADTGVTASDMEIWQQHIRQLDSDTQASLFAVLNKVDMLWDDLGGDVAVQRSIIDMQAATARQLGINHEDVLPLSAKQALLAKVRNDPALLARSQIAHLEDLLCERIVAQKERLIEERVVNEVLSLLQSSQHLLNLRLEKAREQQTLLLQTDQDNNQTLFELTARTRDDHSKHHKRLLGLKTNQRLLARLAEPLRATTKPERMEAYVEQLRTNLSGSWTTLGINQAILDFFGNVANDLDILEHEVENANRMVAAIYRRHNEENPLHGIDPPQFNLTRYIRELTHLQNKADQFRLHPKTLFTEQRILARRFFSTLVKEVQGMMQRLRSEAEQWSNDTLTPLMQHTLEHKQLLETHMLRLKSLSQETNQARHRGQLLTQYISNLEAQLAQANEMLRVLRRPAPAQRQNKVVSLPGGNRQQLASDPA